MQVSAERTYYMDSMRAALMMLVVVLHSAEIYTPSGHWGIHGENTSVIMVYVVSCINVFIMPAFFVVSGYFCYLMFKRYNVNEIVKVRIIRLIIPFITAAVTLNSIQVFIRSYAGWVKFDLLEYIIRGQYVSHLWFLIDLTIFFLAAAFVTAFLKKTALFIADIISRIFLQIPPVLVIILLPFTYICLLILEKLGLPLTMNIYGVINMPRLCRYIPYFVFGILLSYKPELLSRIRTGKTSCLLIIVVIAEALLFRSLPLINGPMWFIADAYDTHIRSWTGTVLCFYFFYKFMNKASEKTMFFSDASYTVYLFHHMFVSLFGLLCIHFGISTFLGVPAMIIVIFTLTLLIHKYFILKLPLMRYLFNGKK